MGPPFFVNCRCNCYFCPRKNKVGYVTLLLTAVLWPPVPQDIQNTIQCASASANTPEPPGLGSPFFVNCRCNCYSCPRIRNFASNCGSVASNSPNLRNHNARALPRALRDLMVWGHPSSSTVVALVILAWGKARWDTKLCFQLRFCGFQFPKP